MNDTSPRSSVRVLPAASIRSQVSLSSATQAPPRWPSSRRVAESAEDSVVEIRSMVCGKKSGVRVVGCAICNGRATTPFDCTATAFYSGNFPPRSRTAFLHDGHDELCDHDISRPAATYRGRSNYAQTVWRVIPSFFIRLRSVLGSRFRIFAAPPWPSILQWVCVSTETICSRSTASSEAPSLPAFGGP